LLVRFGEIFLKVLNRPYFIRSLVRKIRYAVKDQGAEVWMHDGRIYVSGFSDLETCIDRVTRVFGVHSVCPAVEMPKEDFDAICSQAIEMMRGLRCTFKVAARRSDKRYPLDSPAINEEVGYRILQALPELRVDVHEPDHLMNIEIRDHAYLYVRVIPAVGGMPVGTNGKATLLLSGGIDSPVAGWMIAKRGVTIDAIYFHAPPYTSERAKQKVIYLAKIVAQYTGPIRLHVVDFTDIQLYIYDQCPHEELTIIMRRYMMRIAERFAADNDDMGLITGESIGQVASQTMHSLLCTNAVCTLPVYRPLIGFDKNDIVDISRKIGAYETSILPYEDCCTIFVAKHPVTKPQLKIIERSENKLKEKIDELVETAVATAELIIAK
jgi:thiamine biosynthesis protein ThiI